MFCSTCIDSLLKFSPLSSKTSKKAVNFLQASIVYKNVAAHTMFWFRAASAFRITFMKAWFRLLMFGIVFSIPVWSLCAAAVQYLPSLPESSLWRPSSLCCYLECLFNMMLWLWINTEEIAEAGLLLSKPPVWFAVMCHPAVDGCCRCPQMNVCATCVFQMFR